MLHDRRKIMIADDDAAFRDLCVRLLSEWEFEPVPVADVDAARRLLQEPDGPALAVVGTRWGNAGANALFGMLRAAAADRYLYLVAVAPQRPDSDADHLLAALSAGADDLLPHALDRDALRLRIGVGCRVVDNDAMLRTKCIQDGITGVYSRAALVHVLQKELARHGREQRPLALAVLEVDGLPEIAREFDPATATDVLREVAHRLASVVRPYDWVARDDAARLMVLLPTCEARTAADVAARMREVIAERRVTSGTHRIAVTASIGLTCAAEPSASSIAGLMQRAEDALHDAVKAGRNRVHGG